MKFWILMMIVTRYSDGGSIQTELGKYEMSKQCTREAERLSETFLDSRQYKQPVPREIETDISIGYLCVQK